MRITEVDCIQLFVPFASPRLWAGGRRSGANRLLVTLRTDTGLIGYGETICLLEFVRPVLTKTIAPLVLGEDPHNIERVYRKVEGAGYYHHKRAMVAALAAVEMAMWDLVGKNAGVPLYRLWGGRYRDRIEMIAYIHVASPPDMAAEAADFVARGWRTVKVKIGMDPEGDLAIVRAVREAIGPLCHLRADVNGSWTPGTARRQLAKLEKYDLQYVEQPLVHDDLVGHRALRQICRVPIALDEGAYTSTDVLNILRMEAADVILLDGHEAGGWWQARKQAGIAEAAGVPVGLHSGGELGLSTAANLHLAAATPNLSIAIDSSYVYLADDIIPERLPIIGGYARVPEGPGLGVEPDPAKVARYASESILDAYVDPERPDWFTEKPAY